MHHDVPSLSAALSYYTCFSLAPLLLLIIAVMGLVFGRDAAQGQIFEQLSGLIGPRSAGMVQTMIASAWHPAKGIIATLISLVTLLVGAFGVVSELKSGLNRIMKAKEPTGLEHMLKERAKYLGFILGIGFLLLVSLVISAALAAISEFFSQVLPFPKVILQTLDLVLSLGVITLLFAMMFRFLPNIRLPWRAIRIGSFFTAVCFTIGKFALGYYLGRGSVASSYGAAGSVLIILLWMYYSALILYFGAEFTKVYTESTT